MTKPVQLTALRQLDVINVHGDPDFVSAASGLVAVGDCLHVIADDELTLATFARPQPTGHPVPGQLLRLLSGELPSQKKARKKLKPDWEALTLLPACSSFPHGALLALGSGSKPIRDHAAIIALDAHGRTGGDVQIHSLTSFYQQLQAHTTDLNIEAAFSRDDILHFISRGNRAHPDSMLFRCPQSAWLAWLFGVHGTVPVVTTTALALPALNGVAASISDAVAVADGWLAACVAEATDDSYHDGQCVGAALARFDSAHRLTGWWPLAEPVKVEGLVVQPVDDRIEILLVNDPDDRAIPAQLFRTVLPSAKLYP